MVLKLILVVLMFSTCLELFCLLGIVIYWKIKRDEILSPKHTKMCFPSEKLTVEQGIENLANLEQRFDIDKNETFYCGNAKTMLDMLSKKTVAARYNNDANPELPYLNAARMKTCSSSRYSKEVVHIRQIATYAAPVEGIPTKIYWEREEFQKSYFNQLEHLEQEGTILVKQSGLYFISSMITLWIENGTIDAELIDNENVRRHFVNVISMGDVEKVLLENAVTTCEITTAESQQTSMMEAVFWLDENDKIFVASSHPHKLISAGQGNHFIIHSL